MLLSDDLEHTGIHIIIENWYTSLRLCEDMSKKGILITGIIRKNAKGFPVKIK